MNTELELLRKEINEVDEEMKELFKKRMQIVAKISKFKSDNHLPTTDINREKEILKTIELSSDSIIKEYYADVMNALLQVSKDYQNKLNNY